MDAEKILKERETKCGEKTQGKRNRKTKKNVPFRKDKDVCFLLKKTGLSLYTGKPRFFKPSKQHEIKVLTKLLKRKEIENEKILAKSSQKKVFESHAVQSRDVKKNIALRQKEEKAEEKDGVQRTKKKEKERKNVYLSKKDNILLKRQKEIEQEIIFLRINQQICLKKVRRDEIIEKKRELSIIKKKIMKRRLGTLTVKGYKGNIIEKSHYVPYFEVDKKSKDVIHEDRPILRRNICGNLEILK